MLAELKATEIRSNSINTTTDRDELAELLLYVWLRSEVNDEWALPLVVVTH